MVDGSVIPLISGLAIGIAFVVMFSLVFIPVTALTNGEAIEKAKSFNEVQLFLKMHPGAEISIEGHDTLKTVDVHYSVAKQILEPTRFDSGIRTKELVVSIGSLDDTTASFMLICDWGERSSMIFHASTDIIANECIVKPETEVEYDAAPVVNDDDEENTRINLTIVGLQSTYKAGEHIIFTVSAKGVSDNACNINSPNVVMRDNDSGKTIYWPNPFALYYAMGCPGPEPIAMHWTFGDDAESEIILDKVGSYTVIASLEDITTEKQFDITN